MEFLISTMMGITSLNLFSSLSCSQSLMQLFLVHPSQNSLELIDTSCTEVSQTRHSTADAVFGVQERGKKLLPSNWLLCTYLTQFSVRLAFHHKSTCSTYLLGLSALFSKAAFYPVPTQPVLLQGVICKQIAGLSLCWTLWNIISQTSLVCWDLDS